MFGAQGANMYDYNCPNADIFNGVHILDVTDPSNIQHLSYVSYATSGYAHQIAINFDTNVLYLNDETSTYTHNMPSNWRMFDVSDLHGPRFIGSFFDDLNSIQHNCYIKDGFMYSSNYVAGLAVYDVRDPSVAPKRIGLFDAENQLPNAFDYDGWYEWVGTWSNFLFPSGTIAHSDMRNGLFTVSLDYNVNSTTAGSTWQLKDKPLSQSSCNDLQASYQESNCCNA